MHEAVAGAVRRRPVGAERQRRCGRLTRATLPRAVRHRGALRRWQTRAAVGGYAVDNGAGASNCLTSVVMSSYDSVGDRRCARTGAGQAGLTEHTGPPHRGSAPPPGTPFGNASDDAGRPSGRTSSTACSDRRHAFRRVPQLVARRATQLIAGYRLRRRRRTSRPCRCSHRARSPTCTQAPSMRRSVRARAYGINGTPEPSSTCRGPVPAPTCLPGPPVVLSPFDRVILALLSSIDANQFVTCPRALGVHPHPVRRRSPREERVKSPHATRRYLLTERLRRATLLGSMCETDKDASQRPS